MLDTSPAAAFQVYRLPTVSGNGRTARVSSPYSRIVVQIERLIEDRRLTAGDRLPPERELAQLLGVSRPSVREAVRTMQGLGQVRVQHGTGVWILPGYAIRTMAGAEEIGMRDLFSMREVLEVPAAGWAADHATPEAVRELSDILDRMVGSEDFEELRNLDIAFHLRIAEQAGNRFLLRMVGIMHEMLRTGMETTLRIPSRRKRSRVEHRRIADAIARSDAAAARRAMATHIRNAAAAGLRQLQQGEPEAD
jgi:GntR family transcriptional repressor for pyruvate dehydrogenase complex